MSFTGKSILSGRKSRTSRLHFPGFVRALLFLALCPSLFAQTPNPAASGPAKDNPEGFTPGVTLGAKFEGSYSGDGGVYDLGSALGYNFSRHFGVDAGVPFYFVTSPTSTKNSNPGAVSGIGIGSFFTDLRWNYPNKSLNYSSAVHLTAPTGDKKKGFSIGHATWNQSNHFDHAFGDFSPFVDAGRRRTLGKSDGHQPRVPLRFGGQMQRQRQFHEPQWFHLVQRNIRRCGSGARQRLQRRHRL